MSLKDKAYNQKNNFVISLDGPSASGKGLIGRKIASLFSLEYIQSSLFYRGLAFLCIQNDLREDNLEAILLLLEKEDILAKIQNTNLETEEVALFASKISSFPQVRSKITDCLVKTINKYNRVIMEGRDIGTVVAPNADLKIFLTANPEVRAQRRFKQLQEQGKNCILHEVFDSIVKRDNLDTKRSIAPLLPAEGALMVDTSDITPDQVIQIVLKKIDD